jgi:hypothetical protein
MTGLEWFIIIGLFAVFFIISGVTVFIILYRLRWPFKWEKYENINGQTVRTAKGRARLISFGDGGEEIFFLKNLRKWRVAYGKRIGKNLVAWFVGEDGYWYNATFGNMDKRLQEIGVNPVDRDMRYAYASVRKGIDNRYDKKNFLEKWGTVIAFGMLFFCIIAMCGFLWVGFNGQKQVQASNTEVIKLLPPLLEKMDSVAGRLGVPGASNPAEGSGFIQRDIKT